MDQRPYVLVEDIKGQTLDFKKGENARWDIQFVNYGKSPSIKEVTDAHVWVGKNAVAMMDNYFRNLPEIVPPKSAEFIVPPNASGGPNGFHYVTVWSDAVINPDDVVFMKAEDGGVIMAGRTWYYDIFGESHRTDFCRHTLVSGAVSDCPRHNEIR
jgi:hypothetical protein